MNKIIKIASLVLGGILLAGTVYGVNITVPSASGPGYYLVSTSGGFYATTTNPFTTTTLTAAGTTLSQTAYIFATSSDTNLGMTIGASGSTLTWTPVWIGTLADSRISSASNWNTAYSDRLKWDGGATGLVPATGRTSLELGTFATANSVDYASTTGVQATMTAGTGIFLNTNTLNTPWTLSGTSLYPTSTAYNVGIGTTTPSYALTVNGTSSQTRILLGDGGQGAPSLSFLSEPSMGIHRQSSGVLDVDATTQIRFDLGNQATILNFTTSGFDPTPDNTVNLGTSTTQFKNLHLGGSVNFSDGTRQSTAFKDIGFNVVNATTTPTATTTIQKQFFQAITISQVTCSTNGSSITIGMDERASSTPQTAGTDVFNGGSLVCDSDGNSTTTFANATIASLALLNTDIDSTSNSTTTLRVYVKYTND